MINQKQFDPSLADSYQFSDDLCKFWINKLPELELKNISDYSDIRIKKPVLRTELIDKEMIKQDKHLNLRYGNMIPSCCAIDGSRTVERGKKGDIVLIGATRFNDEISSLLHNGKNNLGFATHSSHYDLNSNIAAALMSRYELILAANSSSQLVMLDGSISSTILATNLAARAKFITPLTIEFDRNLYDFLVTMHRVLSGEDNRIYVSCPKATEKREICYEMAWDKSFPEIVSSTNEKELLNQILKAGEYTAPTQLTSRAEVYDDNHSTIHNWHVFSNSLKDKDSRIKSVCNDLELALNHTYVCYYKPYEHSDTVRMEFSKAVARDEKQFSNLLTTMKHYLLPNNLIKEPILLYQADRQAKRQISSATRIFKTRLNWQNYRTDQDGGILGDDY
jgi:hypothetical protein